MHQGHALDKYKHKTCCTNQDGCPNAMSKDLVRGREKVRMVRGQVLSAAQQMQISHIVLVLALAAALGAHELQVLPRHVSNGVVTQVSVWGDQPACANSFTDSKGGVPEQTLFINYIQRIQGHCKCSPNCVLAGSLADLCDVCAGEAIGVLHKEVEVDIWRHRGFAQRR